jgi:hypothetical protein
MGYVLQKQGQKAQTNQDQLGKLYSFKEKKARYRKSYINWDKIERANGEAVREKAKHLSKDAKAILAPVVQKLEKGECVLLNHKYISTITHCERGQNRNILKQLETVLKITYHNSITVDGKRYRHCYEFAYYKQEIVSQTDNSTAQFIERYESLNLSNQAASCPSIENKDIEYIRSNAHTHKSNFLQNSEEVKIEENTKPQITIFPQERVKPVRIKKRLPNERKKPTNAEKKARVYRFNQYEKPQTLSYHYPLSQKDGAKLQTLSGRAFTLQAMNEILLDMSRRRGNTFYSKAQFMVYFAKCLRFEMRDAIKTNNVNFHIKTNHTTERFAEIAQERQLERYLAEVERKAITNICPENQLRARLANTLDPIRSYKLLSNIKDFEVVGNTMRIYLRSQFQLNDNEESIVLSQVQSIYSNTEIDIENVEYVIANVGISTNAPNGLRTKPIIELPRLEQDVWGDICRQLIKTYGIHIYNNWFSKLTHVIDESAKTIELKAPNLFIQQWIEANYYGVIRKIIESHGQEFKGIIQQFTNQGVL